MSSSVLLDEVFKCVEKIGYDKTLEGVRSMQFQEIKYADKLVEHVVTTVSEKTGVPAYEILFGSGRKNERKHAIGFCAYYLHSSEFYNIEMEKVKDFLNKNLMLCYMYSKIITKLNPNYKNDQKLIEIKIELDHLFKKIKK